MIPSRTEKYFPESVCPSQPSKSRPFKSSTGFSEEGNWTDLAQLASFGAPLACASSKLNGCLPVPANPSAGLPSGDNLSKDHSNPRATQSSHTSALIVKLLCPSVVPKTRA